MAAPGRNEGFHVLDEFVCEAIHAPSIPLANPANHGRNEGMAVVTELLFEAGGEPNPAGANDSGPIPDPHSAALTSAIEPLALYISASGDPRRAFTVALELLLTKLHSIDQAAATALEPMRDAGRLDCP